MKSFEDRKRVEALERQSLVTQIEKQALENDLVNSQNNYLRSQINPHFLFNTLNFIYNDARKKAPMAADAIMNLAEMMRYALKRPEASEMVPLSEEVEQIEHLINLHKLRTANTINLELEVKGDLFGLRFPPLILLTLIENIFKHGNVSHSTQPALIKINYENNHLSIKTINMINDVKSKPGESHHVGVENIGKRLNNFYKEACEFKFYQDPLNRYITEIDVDVINPLANLNTSRLT
ncbi:sensor histidine kinase [Pedobacter punctiformis]|uniref:Sensor histidine kinase n=1 Tax=Pedobacter punctiformis TaxID=3004097 RepID=A0ABT4LEF7_9SPHI|nr:sensor histidine kinase [Pedobacter sp. HCMS5-2]MCZ4245234.1 sensor histidine kinase [Pedobacter sp. HCMS5-2]